MRQHAERTLRKPAACLGPTLERKIGRTIKGKENLDTEVIGNPAEHAASEPIHRIGQTIRSLCRSFEHSPKARA